MAPRIEGETRAAVIRAQAQARRLGQRFIGCEHLLYGVAGADDVAGRVLRARGVTPERIEEQVTRLIGTRGPADARRVELDGEALRAIGVDLESVRGRIEEAFGPGALDRAVIGRRRAPGGHLRITREARVCISRSIRGERSKDGSSRSGGTEPERATEGRLTLALLAMDASVPRHILAELGVPARELAAEIERARALRTDSGT